MDGRRQIRRYVPELDGEGVQDLPPENLRRFAFKMATGSGKTWVMAMADRLVPFPQEARAGLGAVDQLPDRRAQRHRVPASGEGLCQPTGSSTSCRLIPPEWRGAFAQKVILRGEATEPDPSGNLFLTNIHSSTNRATRSGRRRTPSRRCSARSPRRTSRIRERRCWSGSSRLRTWWC